jgi:hypothetical protein
MRRPGAQTPCRSDYTRTQISASRPPLAAAGSLDSTQFSHGPKDAVGYIEAACVLDKLQSKRVDNDFEAVNFVVLVTFFRLIQSQAQAGPASTETAEEDSDRLAPLELLLEIVTGFFVDCKHMGFLLIFA